MKRTHPTNAFVCECITQSLFRLMKATVDKGIHDKSTKIELPTLYKVPPKRDYREQ